MATVLPGQSPAPPCVFSWVAQEPEGQRQFRPMGSGHGFDRELLRLLRHRCRQSSRNDLIDFKTKVRRPLSSFTATTLALSVPTAAQPTHAGTMPLSTG